MFYKLIFTLFIFSSFSFSSSDIQNLKSFQSKFTQTITSSSSDIITYQGEVFIKNSGQILWKYKTPVVKNVYIDNNMAIVDEPELEQAIFTTLENEINILKLLKEAKKIDNNNYVSTIDGTKYQISMSSNRIKKITYKDTLDNNVEIIFSNSIQDEPIDDNIFVFVAPSNYDLIRKQVQFRPKVDRQQLDFKRKVRAAVKQGSI